MAFTQALRLVESGTDHSDTSVRRRSRVRSRSAVRFSSYRLSSWEQRWLGSSKQYADYKVRIDSKAVVGGYPALTIRKLVRRLNNLLCWNAETVGVILRTERTEAEAIVRALVEAGLAVAEPSAGVDGCTTTQLAQSFGSATAAKPISRQTADHALSQLLERVNQVNRDKCFLAKVTKVVVLGSYLRADVDRLSDLDIAVELQPKEADWDRLRELTQKRVEQLRKAGRRFSNWLEVEYWWHLEAFRFLKGRSRAISLIDYKAEKAFVDKVPHEFSRWRSRQESGSRSASEETSHATSQGLLVLRGDVEVGCDACLFPTSRPCVYIAGPSVLVYCRDQHVTGRIRSPDPTSWAAAHDATSIASP